MKRIEAIKEILEQIKDEDIVIASTGMISREVYAVKDRPRNFYMMGSMGNTLALGLGIAITSKYNVIVINGDGSALMSLGTMSMHNKLKPQNLMHFILDNNCHSSTGGQPTVSEAVDFESLAPNTSVIKVDKDKGNSPRIPLSGRKIRLRFMKALKEGGKKDV